jgi:glycosyltransferase involved in cell wall biosynthesis
MSLANGLAARERAGAEGADATVVPQLSILTTAHNERGNVAAWFRAVEAAVDDLGLDAEIVFIDDGSTDGTSDEVRAYVPRRVEVRLLRNERCLGITAAIRRSLSEARAPLCALLPADLESDPAVDLPALYRALAPDVDAVAGYREGRGDGKVLASKVYNALNRILFRCDVRDANWVKLLRRDKATAIDLHSDWHRFLLPMMAFHGCKVVEVPTSWHLRTYGRSKFGVARLPGAMADLIAVRLLLSYETRPMLAFLWLAMVAAATGILTGTVGLVAGGLTQVMLLMCALLLVFFSAGIVALGFACEVIRTWITQLKTQGA